MINKGIFENVVNQVKSVAPAQVAAVYKLKAKLLNFSFPTLAIDLIERIFAFLFNIGASILVFYSCNEKKQVFPLSACNNSPYPHGFHWSAFSNGLRNHHTPKPESGYEILPHGTFLVLHSCLEIYHILC